MGKTVLAIDVGSTKICAIIAQINEEKKIAVVGAGTSKSQGLKRGIITNIELASRSIEKAVNDAKRVSGSTISTAVVSVSGTYVKSQNSTGIVNLTSKEVSIDGIDRAMQAALYTAKIPKEYEVLHALPFNFKVDDNDFIEDPLGMNAARLEVNAHIITIQKSTLSNLKKALKGANIETQNIILNGYASSIAVLDESEKELGVAVVDMGGTSCNMVIHVGNSIRYNDFLGVGGNHITNDLSMALHTPLEVADKIKLTYNYLNFNDTQANDCIEIPKIGDNTTKSEVLLSSLQDVIVARVGETLMILAKMIENSSLKEQIGAGIVLTGGFSKMEGLARYADQFFYPKPIRVAKPKELDGLFESFAKEDYACAIGLVLYSAGEFTQYEIDSNKRLRHSNEEPLETKQVNLKDDINIQKQLQQQEEPAPKENDSLVVDITKKNESNQNGNILNKIKNWATQLF